MVEYALLLSLVALALVGTIGGMAGQVGGRFNAISNTLASGGNGGLGGGGTTPGGGGGGTVTPPPTTNDGGSGNNNGGNPGTGNNNGGGSGGTNPNGTIGNTGMTKPEIDKIIDEGADKGLDGISWRQLSKLSPYAAEHKDEFYDWIGTTKSVLVDGKEVKMRLVGIAQDDLADGSGKAGFSFLSAAAVVQDQPYFNFKATNTMKNMLGWDNSNIRTKLQDVYNTKLQATDSSNMKRYIAPVYKKFYKVDGNSGPQYMSLMKISDTLWAPSLVEIIGKYPPNITGPKDDGEQYDFFKDNGVSFDAIMSGRTTADGSNEYWTRSPASTNAKDVYTSNINNYKVVYISAPGMNGMIPFSPNTGTAVPSGYGGYSFMGFCV